MKLGALGGALVGLALGLAMLPAESLAIWPFDSGPPRPLAERAAEFLTRFAKIG